MKHDDQSVSIWFFLGGLLLVYGVLVLAAGVYGVFHPPAVRLAGLHAGIWWGALLLALGALYSWAYLPRGRR